MSRIFFNHSSRDYVEVLALRDWLVGRGWNDAFFDLDPVRDIVAADRWQTTLGAPIGPQPRGDLPSVPPLQIASAK